MAQGQAPAPRVAINPMDNGNKSVGTSAVGGGFGLIAYNFLTELFPEADKNMMLLTIPTVMAFFAWVGGVVGTVARNRKAAIQAEGKTPGWGLAIVAALFGIVFVLGGCQGYSVAGYEQAADSATESGALDATVCRANLEAAAALGVDVQEQIETLSAWDMEAIGGSFDAAKPLPVVELDQKAFRGPFGEGPKIAVLGQKHLERAALCESIVEDPAFDGALAILHGDRGKDIWEAGYCIVGSDRCSMEEE